MWAERLKDSLWSIQTLDGHTEKRDELKVLVLLGFLGVLALLELRLLPSLPANTKPQTASSHSWKILPSAHFLQGENRFTVSASTSSIFCCDINTNLKHEGVQSSSWGVQKYLSGSTLLLLLCLTSVEVLICDLIWCCFVLTLWLWPRLLC